MSPGATCAMVPHPRSPSSPPDLQVHRIVARTAKHDPISDIRQYAKNLLHRVKQAMPSKTSEMQEDYLQEEERVLAMLVRRVSVDSWDAPETDP